MFHSGRGDGGPRIPEPEMTGPGWQTGKGPEPTPKGIFRYSLRNWFKLKSQFYQDPVELFYKS